MGWLISKLLKITGFFCRISPLLQSSFAKETYNFKEPTNCRRAIPMGCLKLQTSFRKRASNESHYLCTIRQLSKSVLYRVAKRHAMPELPF